MNSRIGVRIALRIACSGIVLSGIALGQLGCASRKTRAEAAAAEAYQDPSSGPQTIAPDAAAEPAPAEPAPAEPAGSTAPPAAAAAPAAAADEEWTDEDASPSSATAAAPAASKAETRTMEVIRQFILERREKVRPCYDRAQAGRPNFKGDVMMRFVLSPSGMVQSIEYSAKESTLYAPDVGECIAKEMKTWQFPASSRGMETKVGYPFNFNPRSK